MHPHDTTTGTDINVLHLFATILELAATEPGSIDEANETLYAIEEAAAQAFADRQA